MMNFALKPQPAKESIEMKPGEVENKAYTEPISAGAHLQVFSEAIMGIAESLSKRLISKGVDKKDVNSTIITFLQTVASNGDFDAQFKSWLFDHDFSDIKWDLRDELRQVTPNDKWDSWYIILDNAKGGVKCGSKWSDEFQKKMNPREQELLKTLREAEDKYYDAKYKYEEYVHDHAIDTLNEIFVKYAEPLSKIDKEWYDGIETRLRLEVERLNRRRAEKKAEEDAAAGRAAPTGPAAS